MPPRKLPSNETLHEMYLSGMSSGEIGEALGVNADTVGSALRKSGCPMRSAKDVARNCVSRGRHNPVAYWAGKKQPPEMVAARIAKTTGPGNGRWKHGRSSRLYRTVIAKECCAACGRNDNLGIHHKDFDHYNDAEENLQVLCVSCHMALHKKAWWDALNAGDEPPRSNAPCGWERGR